MMSVSQWYTVGGYLTYTRLFTFTWDCRLTILLLRPPVILDEQWRGGIHYSYSLQTMLGDFY